MKNAILLTLAAAVATVPAILGVTGNTTFSQSIPASIPSGASVVPNVDDKGHDSDATTTPTASRGDAATTTAADGSDDATRPAWIAEAGSSDDGATATATRSATSAKSTVDDRGKGTQTGDDSGGHGGGSGNSGSGKR